jgi:glycosyltransferase 2 family protein
VGERARGGSASRLTAGLAVAAGSYLLVRSGWARQLDATAARIVARPLGDRADRAIAGATDLGSVYGLAGTALALTVAGQRDAAVDVAAGGLIAWSAAQAVKPLLRRERPYELATAERLVAIPAGSSWPSGHVAVVSAMAASLSRRSGRPTAAALWTGVAVVGVTRLYVGVHHLTDLIGGVGVGILAAGAWSGARSAVRTRTAAGSVR